MRRHLLPMLLPLLLTGACQQPPASNSLEVSAAQRDRPPGDDDIPLTGPISPAPRNFRLTANGAGAVEVDFDCGGNAEHHESFHQVAGGAWSKLRDECIEDGPARGHIFDNHVVSGQQVCYKVKASNSTDSLTTDPVCWTVGPAIPLLSIAQITKTDITVRIVDRAVSEEGVRLYRRETGGSFVLRWTEPKHPGTGYTTDFHDTSIELGKTYEYMARVFDAGGRTGDTQIVEAAAFPVPAVQPSVVFDRLSPRSLRVNWSFFAGEVVDTYHMTLSSGPWIAPAVRDFPGTQHEATFPLLFAGTQYCVTIVAENRSGMSQAGEGCGFAPHETPDEWPRFTNVDLYVSNLEAQGTTINWKVCSDGDSDTVDAYRLTLSIDGLENSVPTARRPPLTAGNCQSLSAELDFRFPGLHDVKVTADAVLPYGIAEAFPENNVGHLAVRLP